jgi:hypothetical protein
VKMTACLSLTFEQSVIRIEQILGEFYYLARTSLAATPSPGPRTAKGPPQPEAVRQKGRKWNRVNRKVSNPLGNCAGVTGKSLVRSRA